MESYALAKVCLKFDISFIAFKYISDSSDKDASIEWVENLKKGQKLFKKNDLRSMESFLKNVSKKLHCLEFNILIQPIFKCILSINLFS